ncbi:MAG TPA: tetratricopeptide repeat protein [Patescibacteria group bacterium]|nr:tetratricopeptide repeat protein [Patescibacteria group bacterium]
MPLTDLTGIVRNLTQSSGERAVARALACFSKGQVDKAIAVLKEAQSSSPEDPAVLLELGRMLAHGGRALEGTDAFRALLRKEPQALPRITEAIEELRARHVVAGPMYDAIAELHLRQDNVTQALATMERMRADDLRAVLPRYQAKWEQGRKSAPGGRLTRTTLQPGFHLALLHETLREHDRAIAIYRDIARANTEEARRILPRLEALAARDYQNSDLRLEVAAMLIEAGQTAEAVKHFSLALETNAAAAARPVAERIALRLAAAGDDPELRWVMASALIAAGDGIAALEALRPLVAQKSRLDDVIQALQRLATQEGATGALLLLSEAYSRRGQPNQALAPLLQIAEEKGIALVYEPLHALAEAYPDLVRAHQMLADIHLEAGRAGDAIAALRRARELAPRESGILVPKLIHALARDRTSVEAHLMLADLLIGATEFERAIIVLRHLVRESAASAAEAHTRLAATIEKGSFPRARLGAAEACLALERWGGAMEQLEALAASNPEMTAEFLHAIGMLSGRAPGLSGRIVALLESLEPRSPLPVAVHFARGEALFAGGNLPAAAASYREVLQSAPERVAEVRAALERFDRSDGRAAEARYLLASIYVDQRDHEAALRELLRPGPTNAALLDRVVRRYQAIVAETPADIPARAALMQALLLARQHDKVLELGRDTLRLRDDASTARVSLAMADALVEKGDSEGAVRRYFAAYRRDPKLAVDVANRLKRFISQEGRHPFACLVLGKILVQEGRAEEAVPILRTARAADPALHDSVVLELEALVRKCPADPRPGLALAALLQEAGQHAKAVQVIATHLDAHPGSAQRIAAQLEEILKSQPEHPLAQYELGRALQALGAHARAAERYRTASTLDAAIAPMALRRLQEILVADPPCSAAWLASADVLLARGQPLQAAERLAEAIARAPQEASGPMSRLEELYRRHPDIGAIALLFAEAAMRAGQHDQAANAYGGAAERDLALAEDALMGLDAIVKLSPRLAEARLQRARVGLRLSRGEAALTDLSEAARLSPRLMTPILKEVERLEETRPDWPECTLLHSDLLLAAGRTAEAETLLTSALPRTDARQPRLQTLLRLARCAAERQDETAAHDLVGEAAALAADRNEFLAQAHALHLGLLRHRVAGLAGRLESGAKISADELRAVVQACIDLGDLPQAEELFNRHAPRRLDDAARRTLGAALLMRRGEFARAAEELRPLGPSHLLAFGALRGGDYPLAIQTLEALVRRDADAQARHLLEKTYRDMVAADLLGGSRRLQAETHIHFGEGAAA